MYTKLFNSIITSTVWLEPDATRIVWITLLAMADRHGEVMASVPGLARVAGVDVEACRHAIATLMAPDPDSRTKDQEGRRLEAIDGGWLVINYHKYRDMAASADRAEKAAVRQRRKRDRDSRNVTQRHATVTQESRQFCQAEAEADTDTDITAVAVIPPSEAQPQRIEKPPLAAIADAVGKITGTQFRWTTKRLAAVKARWTDEAWRSGWEDAIERAMGSSFLTGRNDRGWVMDLEFFLRPDTVTKILEGKYDDRECVQPQRLTANQQREAVTASSFDLIRQAAAEQAAISASGSIGYGAAVNAGAIVLGETNGRTDAASG